MLNAIDVINRQGVALNLPFDDIQSGYVVEEIEGLDPVEATLISSSFAKLDGAQYQSSRREQRDMVLKVLLDPDYSVATPSQLRKHLYEYFMPKSEVTIKFYSDDHPTVEIKARVKSFDANLFTKEPRVDVTVVAFNPDFYSPVVQTVPGNTVETTTTQEIDYEGTIETGFIFTLNVNRSISAFTLHSAPFGDVSRTLTFDTDLIAGDVVKISTVSGDKYAKLLRSGVETSVLYGVAPYSEWLQLFPGRNNFRAVVSGAAIPYTIEYTDKYGGL